MLVDSHCHLDFPPLAAELPAVLARMAANGVSRALCVAVSLEGLPSVLRLADEHDHLYASVGVHPDQPADSVVAVDELVRFAQSAKVIAIGETGLDYYRQSGDTSFQSARLRVHIRAARETGKPLIVHCREAAPDLIAILREERAADVGGVMHCFTESWDVAEAAMSLNFYISFSGILTFRNAAALREVAMKVPLERMLVETDSPYLAPVPHRGRSNEPAWVVHVAQEVARLKGISYEEVASVTTANFDRLFHAN